MAQDTKLTRKDLKKPDQFLVSSNKFLDFLARNKSVLIAVVAGLVLAGGGVLLVSHQNKAESLRMESLYYKMTQRVDENKESNGDQLISDLNYLFEQFNEGDQKLRAGVLLADSQYQNRHYDDAISSFKMVSDKASPGALIFFMAQSGLAHSYERKKDFKQAITHFKNIIDRPGEFPLFYTYLGLARCYELTQDTKNALLILREMQTKFSEHADLEKVDLSVKRLEGTA